MKKIINLLLICLIYFCFGSFTQALCIAQETDTAAYSGMIIADSVNLRSGPGVNFEILRKMNKGDSILVVDAQDTNWLKVSLPRNSRAFVYKDYIKVENSIYGVITGERVNVRAGEGTNFNIIGQLAPEDRIEIIAGRGKDWFEIYPYTNCFAWVHKDFVKKSGPAKIYIDNEDKKREGNKLLLEAEVFENTNKTAALDKSDLSPIIQKYKVLMRSYTQTPASEKARAHIKRLEKIKMRNKIPEPKNKVIQQKVMQPQVKKPAGKEQKVTKQKTKKQKVKKQKTKKQKAKKQNVEQQLKNKEMIILTQPDTEPAVQGKIIDAGIFFNRPGTHRLVLEGKTHYFLKSDKVNLNDYIYHQVQIWGKIKSSKKSKIPVVEVDFIKKLN